MSARHDPVAHRHVPDPTLVHRAHNWMLDREEASSSQPFIRQQWDAAMGATRVALDAIREIWPAERGALSAFADERISDALWNLTRTFAALDDVAPEMVGAIVVMVQSGAIKTEEEFDAAVAQADATLDGGQDE